MIIIFGAKVFGIIFSEKVSHCLAFETDSRNIVFLFL